MAVGAGVEDHRKSVSESLGRKGGKNPGQKLGIEVGRGERTDPPSLVKKAVSDFRKNSLNQAS